ncbi:hypothetical protein E3N88_02679 [Mikania micrantha]|uniref:Reverse transcriptase zinc-binding domain-containing protein n=1 Tax=Mikania micrantha TaxID=192012 RepID=A0A5N6Q4X1_9ASTR|nr:hypothetical protein E3N88_02679 [Mikania micrantha]
MAQGLAKKPISGDPGTRRYTSPTVRYPSSASEEHTLTQSELDEFNNLSRLLLEVNITIPKKVNIVSWQVELDRQPTVSALSRRNINIGPRSCIFCGVTEETTGHLFTACQLVTYIWSHIETWCKLPPIFAFSSRDLMDLPNSLTVT